MITANALQKGLIIALVLALGAVGFSLGQLKKTTGPNAATVAPKVAASTSPSSSPGASGASVTPAASSPAVISDTTSITPYQGKPIPATLPNGWSKMGESVLDRKIDGVNYRIMFQMAEQDNMKQPAYSAGSTIVKATKTANGNPAYIVKVLGSSNVAVSSCPPSGSQDCSFMQDGKYLLITMYTWKNGDATPMAIDFGTSSATTAVNQFIQLVESLKI